MSSTEKVTKVCNPDGQWFHHPESNRVWTNYTQCQTYTKDKRKVSPNAVKLMCVRTLKLFGTVRNTFSLAPSTKLD